MTDPEEQPTVFAGPTDETDTPTVSIAPATVSPLSDSSASMESPRALTGMGLATKYFLMAAALIVTTIGSGVLFTAYYADQVADRTVREALEEVERVWDSFSAEQEMQLRKTIRTLADEPQTRALLAEATVTPETVQDWTQDKIAAAGAEFLAVLDPTGAFVARSDRPVEEFYGRSIAHASFVQSAMAGMDASAMIREGDTVYRVAAAPVMSGQGEQARFEGIIYAGYPLTSDSAGALASLSGNDATILSVLEEESGPRPSLLATTLDNGPALVQALEENGAQLSALLTQGENLGPVDLFPEDDHVIAAGFPIKTGSGIVVGAFVSSRSLKKAKAAFTQIQMALIGVGFVSLLISLPASYLFGRRIAQPLMTLAASAQSIREGKLDVSLPEAGGDEVGLLARSFSQMVSELREKDELEKFVAGLGLSAHDITQGRITSAEVSQTLGTAGPEEARGADVKLEPGVQLGGRYRIEGMLGQGGMGSVWRAHDRELDEDVALKVIRNDVLASDPAMVDNLKDEIRLARRISHPNILRTHDFGDLDGIRFISMEFVPGPTLRTVIDKRGPLSLPIGLQLGRQLCRGLAAAHDAGVIHRDIKPHNIIIGPNGVAKIMDFGIAFSHEKHEGLQGEGTVVGTPDYMSPEQIEGDAVDARADIYAVGIVLYEMFTGIRPFKAANTVQTLMRNLNEIPKPLREIRPELPPLLEDLVARATAKNPDERIQSASSLKKALGQISS